MLSLSLDWHSYSVMTEGGMSGTADYGLFPVCAWLEAAQQLSPKSWECTLGWVQGEHAALRASTVVACRTAAAGNSAQSMGTTHSSKQDSINRPASIQLEVHEISPHPALT